jgi:hypothetical protein
MKIASLALALSLIAVYAHATELRLITVKQPVYLHDADTNTEISIMDVHVATSSASLESTVAAISLPFVPVTDGSWKEPTDINLASSYGIAVSANGNDPEQTIVTIDASAAKVPEGYPFTIDQVIDSVSTCVKLMHPARPEYEEKMTWKIIPPKRQQTGQPKP